MTMVHNCLDLSFITSRLVKPLLVYCLIESQKHTAIMLDKIRPEYSSICFQTVLKNIRCHFLKKVKINAIRMNFKPQDNLR
jgi:hypothetical protein